MPGELSQLRWMEKAVRKPSVKKQERAEEFRHTLTDARIRINVTIMYSPCARGS